MTQVDQSKIKGIPHRTNMGTVGEHKLEQDPANKHQHPPPPKKKKKTRKGTNFETQVIKYIKKHIQGKRKITLNARTDDRIIRKTSYGGFGVSSVVCCDLRANGHATFSALLLHFAKCNCSILYYFVICKGKINEGQ